MTAILGMTDTMLALPIYKSRDPRRTTSVHMRKTKVASYATENLDNAKSEARILCGREACSRMALEMWAAQGGRGSR